MSKNKVCSEVDAENGWNISVLKPVLSNREKTSEFQYTIQRSHMNSNKREIGHIHMNFCTDITDLDITDCSMKITYMDQEDIGNAPVTMVFSDLCAFMETQPRSECISLSFDDTPYGDDVIGGNYIQDRISICFKMNKKLWTDPIKMVLKTETNVITSVFCGFIYAELSLLSNNVPESTESIALTEAVLTHMINVEEQKLQAAALECETEDVENDKTVISSSDNTFRTIFKMQLTIGFRI
ncbi:MAG TPA: hypothetical protein DDZ89_02915 [Clostridiales bacterium]|nr:hypothetical protein [Clostridiales bacterium]